MNQFLNHELLHIVCRNHILELIGRTGLSQAMETSSATDILLFKFFKINVHNIDKTTSAVFSTYDYTGNTVVNFINKKLEFFEAALKVIQPKDDYRVLLGLGAV